MLGEDLGKDTETPLVRQLNLPAFTEHLEKVGQETHTVTSQPVKVKDCEATPPFILGEALPVVPAKLVKRIRRGEYVDMAELLKDNIEAERRRLASVEEGGSSRGVRREVPNLWSWLQCYSLFAAILCNKYPEKARELWAYQATIIGEAKRCGGSGWHLYDTAFRQQISSIEKADFSKINQSLYSTTFLAYAGRSQFCPNCMLSDHTQEECALTPVPRHGREPIRERQQRSPERAVRSPERRRRQKRGACFAWNDGRCPRVPYCPFDHVCSKCFGNHRGEMCRVKGSGASKEKPRS